MTLMQEITWSLSVIVALFIGGFLKSYMGKKGENLATKEDLQDLVNQVAKVTRAQEEIKQQITGEYRLWERRREFAYDVMKVTGVVGHLFVTISGVYDSQRQKQIAPALAVKLMDDLKNAEAKSRELLERLWEFEGLAHLIFDEKIVEIIRSVINTSVVLFLAAQSPFDADKVKATDAFGKRRGEANFAFQQALKGHE